MFGPEPASSGRNPVYRHGRASWASSIAAVASPTVATAVRGYTVAPGWSSTTP